MGGTRKVPFRRRQLCRMLRQLRDEADIKQETAAEKLRFSHSKLSRLESGQLPGYHELRAMLDLYGVIVNDWPPILALWERAKEKGWWHAYGVDDRGYVSLEADATSLRDYSFGYIPGLLQSEAYTRAVLASNPRMNSVETEKGVAIRRIRQRRLDEGADLALHAIFDEAILRRPGLTDTELQQQLALIVQRAEQSNVRVQVIPLGVGVHSGQAGAFTVLSFPDRDEPDVAYLEHPFGSVHIEDAKEVHAARLQFDHLADVALDELDSTALLREMINEV